MRATLCDSIKVRRSEIPPRVLANIEHALTIPNPRKDVAQRELLWGADRMDDCMRLYSYDDDGFMVLPMGFIHALVKGCMAEGIQLELNECRRLGVPLLFAQGVSLRGYQEPMCRALVEGQCGVVEAPTAAGKTAVTLEAIRRVGRNALVIVEKGALAKQWMDAVQRHLSIDVGFIGEGGARLGPITIALRQALCAREEELVAGRFFERWGIVVVDEAHHAATAWSLIELIQRFTSVHRWGVTATPDRDPDYFPVLQAVIGPVLWETTMRDAADHLVIPRVRVIDTEFDFEYRPTAWAENPETGKRRRVGNNYAAMMGALCVDEDRNKIIAAIAVMEARAGHHVLIVSDRKEHLEHIQDLIGDGEILVHMLIGGDKRYLEVKHTIETADCGSILLSTVADEGLSIDCLDRVIAAYPRRNVETMRQIVGRIMRPWPGKTDAFVIDLRDHRQEVLRSQFKDRAQLLYGREGWEMIRG